jgi:hypothetical protein
MNDKRDKQGGSQIAFTLCVVAIVVSPFAYVLSIGPAYWLMTRGYLTTRAYTAYLPIGSLMKEWPVFGDLINWYIALWVE